MLKKKLVCLFLSSFLLVGCNTSNNTNQSSDNQKPSENQSSETSSNSESTPVSSSEESQPDSSDSSIEVVPSTGVYLVYNETFVYPMSYYAPEQSYVYGFTYMSVGNEIFVSDNGVKYGASSMTDEQSLFPGYHTSSDDEVVLESSGSYVFIYNQEEHLLAFERLGTIKEDESFSVVLNNDNSFSMGKNVIPVSEPSYSEFMQIFDATDNDDYYLDYIDENGLVMWNKTLVLETGDIVRVKGNMSAMMNGREASIVRSVPVELTNDGDIRVVKNGLYNVCYFPGLGIITMTYFTENDKYYVTTEEWAYDMTVNDEDIAVSDSIILYANQRVRILNANNEFVDNLKEGETNLFPVDGEVYVIEDGRYVFYYDIQNKEFYVEKQNAASYVYYLGGCASNTGNFVVNEENTQEVVNRNVKITKNDYGFYVMEFDTSDYSYVTYYELDDSVSSEYAENVGSGNSLYNKVNKGGYYDVYFNTVTKLIRIVFIEELPDGPLEYAKFLCESTYYTMTVNPEDENEFVYMGLETSQASAYMAFFDQNYGQIDGITLSEDEGTQDAAIASSVLFYLKYQGTYNLYLNRTTKVLTVELVSKA